MQTLVNTHRPRRPAPRRAAFCFPILPARPVRQEQPHHDFLVLNPAPELLTPEPRERFTAYPCDLP